ncbi:MAG TPA: dTMP kinase [Leucothrix mucor]|uniref:Thymidylate kinase n=1 Tax=Leucothrix mucor TaxID=45248 RepID=A0A7V2T1Y7_LEUMU|nr:dTMP kinase [Leucothrix mucor]
MEGQFITFEGVEGGGKTTNINFIAELLQKKGKQIVLTREPGGTEVSEAIREILLSKELPAMHQDTELLLMFAARAEHVKKKILPALAQGKWVLCDRFTDASYAYQGGGRGIKIDRIAILERWVQGDFRPDHTFLFDLDAETGLNRAKRRGETDRFEQENIDFFNRIRAKYLEMAEKNSDRYHIINAQYDLARVQQQVVDTLNSILSSL